MCGLFAYTGQNGNDGRDDHHRALVRDMMIEAGRRGPHAFGFTWIGGDGLAVMSFKTDGSLEKAAPRLIRDLPVERPFVGHARLATGQRIVHEDTQPFVSEDSRFVVAHNGTVPHHTAIYDRYGYTPKTTNDSEALLCIIQHEGLCDGMKVISRGLEVPVAVVAYSADDGWMAYCDRQPLFVKPVDEGLYLCSRLVALSFNPIPQGEIFVCQP